jgi:ribosome-associated translation inhibitor RaiA
MVVEVEIAANTGEVNMQILINTDKNISGNEAMTQHTKDILERILSHFSSQITRLEVHLSDENSASKFGVVDKRCVLEARLAGRKPTSVSDVAFTIDQVVTSVAHKMSALLESELGKLGKHLNG